jgi:hypothetical protein
LYGLIAVAAVLVGVVYVTWSRFCSSGARQRQRRNRRDELRNELELTESSAGQAGTFTNAYDYHDRTGTYNPNELI